MTSEDGLSGDEVIQLNVVTTVLIPGSDAPAPMTPQPSLDQLLERAVSAVGSELDDLRRALALLPSELNWDTLARFAATHASAFELISTVAVGAHFMSPSALKSIGYPSGPRHRAPLDQAVDELGYGLLQPVLDRGSMVRLPPIDES